MRPLDDFHILAIEQYGAGPFGYLLLADLGAEVIRIEDPATGGDVARYVPPYAESEDSRFFQSLNRNKRSISLDLRNEQGRRVFEKPINTVDQALSDDPTRARGMIITTSPRSSAPSQTSTLRSGWESRDEITTERPNAVNTPRRSCASCRATPTTSWLDCAPPGHSGPASPASIPQMKDGHDDHE